MHVGKLADWFSRPVNIHSVEWNESASITPTRISPWHAYFTNSVIAPKLKGFSRLRADLHIKVIVNGSPFRFGEAMLSYRPLYSAQHHTMFAVAPFFSGGQIQGDVILGYPNQDVMADLTDRTTIMARSQRMNLRIQPHVNSGGEMTLPFIYYKDAITISDNPESSSTAFHQALREMGTLTLESLTQLRSTAGAQAQGVSVQIYAWATNVKVWGPTAITVQGIDEYESTMKPSEVASTVAEAAGELAKIPVISRYALATQFLANSTAGVLKYFGWSNPPVLHAVEGKLPKASFMNPNPNLSFPDDVLALDPKNELTVDPRTVGASPEDPLIVERFCARPAIVAIQDWQVAANYSDMIAAFPVMPSYFIATRNSRPASFGPANHTTRLTMIPAAYASSLFEHWRGTFVLHIKAVTSQFHRGRLLIQWDPLDTTTTGIFRESSCISHILDLSTATEATIKVPYMSSYGMQKVSQKAFTLNTASAVNFECCTRGSTTHSWTKAELERFANGIVYVRVMNQLQCGDATADVSLIFSIHFEDMQLMGPNVAPVATNITNPSAPTASIYTAALTDFTAQGLEAPGTSEDTEMIPGGTIECVARLYGGEVVRSLRTLLHRTYPYRFKTSLTDSSAIGSVVVLNGPRFPIGHHIKGGAFMDRAVNTDSSDNTNIVFNTPICLLSACFVGHRGSMVWKCHAFGSLDAFCLSKAPTQVPSISRASLSATSSNQDVARHLTFVQGMCPSGAAWTSNQLAGTVSGIFPPYSNLRMMPGNPVTLYYDRGTDFNIDSATTKLVEEDGIRVVGYKTEPHYTAGATGVPNPDVTLALSVAAGSDFNVFEFVNVPDLYIRAT